MKQFVFMTEEKSMEIVLKNILPRIVSNVHYIIIPHEGKSSLRKSVPRKIRAWKTDAHFIILMDNDGGNCYARKKEILNMCSNANPSASILVRIVCQELESWFLGDIQALKNAYPKVRASQNSRRFRSPDNLNHAKEALKNLASEYAPVSGAHIISPYLDVHSNCSHSFGVFRDGIKNLIQKCTCNENHQKNDTNG